MEGRDGFSHSSARSLVNLKPSCMADTLMYSRHVLSSADLTGHLDNDPSDFNKSTFQYVKGASGPKKVTRHQQPVSRGVDWHLHGHGQLLDRVE